jgi:hypothetical protein
MVVWVRRAGHCTRQLYAAVRPANGAFTAGVTLGPRFHVGCESSSPETSVAGAGHDAILGWVREGTMQALTLTG